MRKLIRSIRKAHNLPLNPNKKSAVKQIRELKPFLGYVLNMKKGAKI